MDKGPWTVEAEDDNPYLQSDDFTHDVILRIEGDFKNFKQKIIYADYLAKCLNNSLTQGKDGG